MSAALICRVFTLSILKLHPLKNTADAFRLISFFAMSKWQSKKTILSVSSEFMKFPNLLPERAVWLITSVVQPINDTKVPFSVASLFIMLQKEISVCVST